MWEQDRSTQFQSKNSSWVVCRLLAVAFLAGAPEAQAENEPISTESSLCEAHERYVELSFVGLTESVVESAILRDLAAELTDRKIGVCRPGTVNRSPLSQVVVSRPHGATISIEIMDSLTQKRVSRDIQLERNDKSTNALVIALAVDELLRATWAELSLRQDGPTERAAALAPQEVNRPPAPPSPSRRSRLGVGAALDYYVRGTPLWGADVTYGLELGRWLDGSLSAGPRFSRQSVDVTTADAAPLSGHVRAQSVVVSTTFAVPLLHTRHVLLGPQVSAMLAYAWFSGDVDAPARGGTHRGFVTQLSAGAYVRSHLGRFFVQAQTEWGAPLLALEITDGRDRIGGLIGSVSASRLYVGLTLP